MHPSQIITALAIPALISAATVPLTKRKAMTGATLIAYGGSTAGWPIAYNTDNRNLYLLPSENTTIMAASSLVQVRFALGSIGGSSTTWVVNATYYTNSSSAGALFIRPEAGNAIGVLPMETIMQMNGTGNSATGGTIDKSVHGFATYGSQLMYGNETGLEAKFWARPGSGTQEGLYELVWGGDNDMLNDGSFPVAVKAKSS